MRRGSCADVDGGVTAAASRGKPDVRDSCSTLFPFPNTLCKNPMSRIYEDGGGRELILGWNTACQRSPSLVDCAFCSGGREGRFASRHSLPAMSKYMQVSALYNEYCWVAVKYPVTTTTRCGHSKIPRSCGDGSRKALADRRRITRPCHRNTSLGRAFALFHA